MISYKMYNLKQRRQKKIRQKQKKGNVWKTVTNMVGIYPAVSMIIDVNGLTPIKKDRLSGWIK